MSLLRKLHKWIGLLVGIQVLLWVLSGLVIALLDPAKVSGQLWRHQATNEPLGIPPGILLEPHQLPAEYLAGASEISLVEHQGQAVYRVRQTTGVTLLDAADGVLLTTGKTAATELALRDFTGAGEVVSVTPGTAPDRETRKHNGAYWRVDFSDAATTSIYVSAADGTILERRNKFWRVHDFFWMLHIMDYDAREDFNNPLVISIALIASWLGLSGMVLLLGGLKRRSWRYLFSPGHKPGSVS